MTDQTDVPRIYTNFTNLAAGPYDLTLTFAETKPVLPGGFAEPIGEPASPTITPVGQVVMSWGHAKAILPLLVKLVAQYEETFGEIPAPGFDQTSKE